METGKPVNVELRISDVGMMRFKLDLWIESAGAFFRNLCASQQGCECWGEFMAHTKALDFLMCS